MTELADNTSFDKTTNFKIKSTFFNKTMFKDSFKNELGLKLIKKNQNSSKQSF